MDSPRTKRLASKGNRSLRLRSDLPAGGTVRKHLLADTMLGFRPYAHATTHRESLPLIGVVSVFQVFHGIVTLLAKDGKIDLSNLFTSGSSSKKVTYALKDAKITSLSMSTGPTLSASVSTQETIGLAAAELDTLTEASTVSVQPATQPPPVQISLALGAPTADPKAAGALISENALSAQIAGGNNASFVIRKAIDSASAQFQQAYLTKAPVASVTITIQRSSGKLTFKLTNAVVTNDIQSSGSGGGEQVTLSAAKLEVASQIAAAH